MLLSNSGVRGRRADDDCGKAKVLKIAFMHFQVLVVVNVGRNAQFRLQEFGSVH